MESAFINIISVICMMDITANRTFLTCVCGVYILNGYA